MKLVDPLTSHSDRVVNQLATLSPEKRALLELRLAQRGVHRAAVHPIPRRTIHQHIPLSLTQERLWFLDQLEPHSALYNTTSAMRLHGGFNLTAFRLALTEVIRRHETLRTTFPTVDGTAFQVIANQPVLHLDVVDLQSWCETEREDEALRLISEESHQPFDLPQGPLVRALLVQLGAAEHLLALTIHHIISDGWSRSVLFRELAALYEAFVAGQSVTLPLLPIQYADFAIWQRQQLHSAQFAQHLTYWKEHLAGVPPLLDLPTDRPRPTQQTYRGAVHAFTLPASVTPALKALSQGEEATLFMTLLAAFQVLLSRYTGQSDIVVGSPIAGRTQSELEGLIGFFANTVVLRTSVSHTLTFREFLHRVREIALNAYAHQDVPYEHLVAELQPQRHLSYSPLIQVLFALQNVPPTNFSVTGVQATSVRIDHHSAKFDLSLLLWDEEHDLRGEVEYNIDLFDKATIMRLVGHYQTLLEGIIANPDQPLASLPLLTSYEQHQLLAEWNATKRTYPHEQCVHQLFEAQVERTPDAIAVVCEDQQLTYSDLNRRANQLAHYLQRLGVGPDVLIALCMDRSVEMVVGLLGILKAGGAYVPLDPSYPQGRLAFMLADTQAPVVLTQQHLLDSLPSHHAHVLCLDRDWATVSRESPENLPVQTTAENLAYVIYTSGSTGQPKGVQIAHNAFSNFVATMKERPGMTATDTLLAVTTLSFDIAALEIFLPLTVGARVVAVSRAVAIDGATLARTLEKHRVTVMQATPATWRMLIDAGWRGGAHVKSLCGGEALPQELAAQLLNRCVQLWNLYGPTETTIWSARHQVKSIAGPIPIGCPIANTQVYILDAHLHPVPIGVTGELYIGGDGLARGYLNRPELTAEKFIPDPFSTQPGARLYCTGDLARYLPDGNIEFLGRIDHQVKIRGYRIELGEIETVLAQHPSAREAVVLAREDKPGDKRLVAYLVSPGLSVSVSEVRRFLTTKLPEYMVPAVFVVLEAFPLTPNGKIDRRALPTSEQTRPDLAEGYVAPRTPVEELLANIWAEVLIVERVGVHDNFFDLGGHSLLATQLISRIRDTFTLELPLRTLFEAPTVAEFAAQLEGVRKRETGSRALPILPTPSDGEYPSSFSQERFWFLEQLEPNNAAYKVAFSFRLTGPLDIGALERSLAEIIRRHESLRTTFHQGPRTLVQRVSDHWSFRLQVMDVQSDLGEAHDTTILQLLENEYGRAFDLAKDLLLRGILLRVNDGEHALMISSHHISWDHWSDEIFLGELSALYHAFATAKPSPLVELPIQYKHYALWQRAVIQGREFDTSLAYWKEQLGNAPASLHLHTDHPRTSLKMRRGHRQTLILPHALRNALVTLSRKANVTLFITVLAAFQTLLHRITGDDDVVVGTPVAGRDRSETEGLIGLFLNSLVLRANFSGNPTVRELLTRVREVALGAYDHQEFPFEKLVAELHPERDLRRTPLFQVFINMYNFKEATLELAGVSVKPLAGFGQSPPQFDLEFFLREHADGTHLVFSYDTDLFEPTTIQRLLGHLQVLLEGIAANPDARISDLPILTEAEQHQLLVEWNGTRREYPHDRCVHQLFEAQIERTPDAIAVVCEDQQLTYSDLNRRANQLAHYLQRLGVGPDVLIALCMDRSVEMVVGLLGILKAGGAYVPLDPSYPQGRLAFMLADTQAPVVLTQQHLLDSLPSHHAHVLCLDRDWATVSRESPENLPVQTTAENLAYVIYTSGSTGQPKGVAMPHRPLCNLFAWQQAHSSCVAGARTVQFSSLSFDVSCQELFSTWCSGGTLVLLPTEIRWDPTALLRFLTTQQIARLFLPFVALQQLAEAAESAASLPAQLHEIITAGEQLQTTPQIVRLIERLKECRLVNQYGPTESHVVTAFPLEAGPQHWSALPPIGRPIANATIYILDRGLNPVPIGVTGELHIGGDGLARGYLNRPELTAEKFIPDTFSTQPGVRLYRTGDLVRYLPDGNIEYLGRIDHQVKIRGYRIELDEIETVLALHPSVRETVVLAREDSPGDKRLVAYLVSRGPAVSVSEVRRFLTTKLPEYMVPAVFVVLEAFPLTPNGKIDRRALPAPDQTRPDLEERYVAPRTPVEELLASIWIEVLKLERVGVHDNFFDLGGHSLLATQVIARINTRVHITVPLRAMFECPTVAAMAKLIEEQQGQQVSNEAFNSILSELEAMSEEEAEKLLTAEV